MRDDLSVDWDDANTGHIARHGITPHEVEQLFLNDTVDLDFDVVDGEDRWTSIGHTDELRILVIVWTIRRGAIRPVTAFEADRELARDYLDQKGP